MNNFVKVTESIYRLKVQFEDLYTSVFLLETEEGYALVDCATCNKDVDEIILPALNAAGVSLSDIKYLVLTHGHSDHAGGLKRILQFAPNMEIIAEKSRRLFKDVSVYELKGHTEDCIGVLDGRSGTLISGDGLQGDGIGKYRCALESKEEYIKTIEKIRKDKTIENILFSHAYEPWYKDYAFGRAEVERCLQDCLNALAKL